ncbi:hypothetical protein [Streptomyces sp. NBC_01455]|uniref:hypothetical protein n=1 Tax=Streptomyces sp. NBC_01455 TaxID=2903874 RepID=UPI002E301094|nr:hypothetical protein [Streptomyces sp. NBC_01455]
MWLRDLAAGDPNHSLHVVCGIEPAKALEILGVEPASIRPCDLPDSKPDEFTSLPCAALGIEPGSTAVLLAGRVGEWTFVYDDSGYTFDSTAGALSGYGRTAATSVYTINGEATLTFALDGDEVEDIVIDNLILEEDLLAMPAELRTAFEAAGVAEWEDLEPGEVDSLIGMRAACALAGLALTLDDVRRIPLLMAQRHEAG